MKTLNVILFVLVGMGSLVFATETKTPAVLLQEGIYAEETEGNLEKAIEIYNQIREQYNEVERISARATYQLGMCYLKKGENAKAAEYFRQVVSNKEASKVLVEKARQQLEGIRPSTSASIPLVVRTNPTALTNNVDPNLDKITVTFNTQMMDQSWSWTGGGDTYPQTTGRPYYDETKTTCTLPVKLESGKVYWVGINSPSHQNFKTPDRTQAKRYVILFATKSSEGKSTTIPEDLRVRAEAINTESIAGQTEGGMADVNTTVKKSVMTISTCAEGDPRIKAALASLKSLDQSAVITELTKYLSSEENTIRRSAVYVIWRGEFSNIEPAIVELEKLCSHKEDFTRGMAALALGQNKVKSSFAILEKMTLNDQSGYARRCGAYALGLMGDPQAKPVLEKALNDPDKMVQDNAKAALRMFELN